MGFEVLITGLEVKSPIENSGGREGEERFGLLGILGIIREITKIKNPEIRIIGEKRKIIFFFIKEIIPFCAKIKVQWKNLKYL